MNKLMAFILWVLGIILAIYPEWLDIDMRGWFVLILFIFAYIIVQIDEKGK